MIALGEEAGLFYAILFGGMRTMTGYKGGCEDMVSALVQVI